MTKRVAFFADKQEVEKYYNIETPKEILFDAHYNLSPGHQLPVITLSNGQPAINRVRWGTVEANGVRKAIIKKENLLDVLKNKNCERCVLPLSGFFIWKEDQEKNHPFFVRMLNSSVMSVAGIYSQGEEEYANIVTTESNALIQPMSARMPLLLDQPTALQWIDPNIDTEDLLKKAENLFLLTDLSVLRVSKKVNDPSNDSSDLIQPIPK